jgi:enoyl-CoA hydratase/carnithine racemase
MGALVLLEEREGVAVVRLNRPDKRNAMDRASRIALLDVFQKIRGRISVAVLTGTGEAFCSGVDLKEHKQDIERGAPPDPSSDWIEVIVAVREHPAVFIAAVNGLALGGGSTLISVCDLAIAADEAEIGMPEIGFGAYPQFSGPGAQKQLTSKRAAWLVLTGERIDGRTAQDWGMVNASVPRAQLMDVAQRLAAKIARFDPFALAQAKRALDTVPAKISEWRKAFEYGLGVNARIRERAKSPLDALAGHAVSSRSGRQGTQS